ncbi:MOSC domain-containing protein [Glycomyces paridis]|uniref:MOSC domain-containing protein n=1 Tax=Glycomyces paridis TaxID=2126555 RepID=A0A4S8P3Q4_9ACTN|nr:MOSC N-terminal beta barrel domain-containing protein [Glycomyces paridis]THV24598.1 MOSC domain-containing protein [Glycomyces paridis]
MFAGEIRQLWRYPVKGLRGESLRSAKVDFDGLAGDRTFGLFEPGTDKSVWGGSHPRMMAWEAAWPAQCGCADAVAGEPVLYEGGGAAWAADDAALPGRLAATIGADKGVELRPVRRDYGRMLVVFESSVRELGRQLGREVEAARFRPNVIVDTDLEPFAETALEPGTKVRLGGHEFTLQKPCERCVLPSWSPDGSNERDMELHKHVIKELGNHFGIYVRIDETVTIAVGDTVVC